MRAALKYGIPAAAGLATGGYALSQGEDPGSAILAGLAGGAGAGGGLLAGRMAGRYAPQIAQMLQDRAVIPMGNIVSDIGARVPKESKIRAGAVGKVADVLSGLESRSVGPAGERLAGKLAAGVAIPASAGLAGLGGIAAGAIPGAMGVPGFQQNVITNPEMPGSSNTEMARSYTPSLRYLS